MAATTELVGPPPRAGRVPRWRRPSLPAGPRTRTAAAPIELSPAIGAFRWGLLAITGLTVWLLAYALVFSGIQEQRDQYNLYAKFREQLARQTAWIGADVRDAQHPKPIPAGEPVAILNSAAGHLHNLVVVEGTDSAQLRSGPGHVRNSVLPGQVGASQIFGRSVTFGGPFGRVTDMQPGDDITAVTGQGTFLYHVLDVRRPGDTFPPQLAAGGSQLTLVTSESSGWRTGWAPTSTVYVDAVLVKPKTAAASPGYPAAIPAEESAMHADTSDLIVTVFWLQGLLIAALVTVWAWRRWGSWQTWTAGGVVLFALLWGTTDSASVLLPNLF